VIASVVGSIQAADQLSAIKIRVQSWHENDKKRSYNEKSISNISLTRAFGSADRAGSSSDALRSAYLV
jgi:hypothetical protein